MGKGRSNRSRSTSSSRHDKPKDKSSAQTKSNIFASESSSELLHQLGRAVLSYSMRRLSGQGKSPLPKPGSKEREKSNSPSKSRDDRDGDYRSSSRRSRSRAGSASRTRQRDRTRDRDRDQDSSPYQSRDRAPAASARSDSSDLYHLLGQVAVGLFGYGIRQYLHHRKVSKQRAAIGRPARRRPGDAFTGPNQNTRGQRTRGFGGWGFGSGSGNDKRRPSDRGADPELAAALESITADLEGTSKTIRKLAGRSPPHKCDLHQRLRDEADGIQAGIERVQTSVNNVRNLHGGLRNAADTPYIVTPPAGNGVAAAGVGGNDKRKVKKEKGLQREGSDAEDRSRTRGAGSYGHGGSRRAKDEDGDRKRGFEDRGYRHSSRLYSTRDRHREERRR